MRIFLARSLKFYESNFDTKFRINRGNNKDFYSRKSILAKYPDLNGPDFIISAFSFYCLQVYFFVRFF